MSNNDEHKEKEREVPIVEEDFATLLGKFRIKPEVAKNIADNISHIGGQTVFETPGLLTRKLAAWSTELSPAKRKLIIEQWFAERGIEVPEEVIEQAGKGPDELKREARGKEEAENIYSVDADTGIIRLATGNEKATTLTEAKELQKLIKKDLEAVRKRQETEGGGKEPPFTLDEGGTWTLNPKAKIGFGEFAVFQMYQDSLRRGEPIDPVEELTRREEQSVRLREAMGVKTGDMEGITLLDKLDKYGMLRKPGEEGRGTQLDLLDKLDDLGLLKKKGEDEGGSQISALETQVKELTEELRKRELDALKSLVSGLSGQVSELRADMAKESKLEGRYALMDKAIGAIDSQLSGIRGDIKPLLAGVSGGGGPGLGTKSPEEKARISKGLKEAVALEKEARDLEDELLFGGRPEG